MECVYEGCESCCWHVIREVSPPVLFVDFANTSHGRILFNSNTANSDESSIYTDNKTAECKKKYLVDRSP